MWEGAGQRYSEPSCDRVNAGRGGAIPGLAAPPKGANLHSCEPTSRFHEDLCRRGHGRDRPAAGSSVVGDGPHGGGVFSFIHLEDAAAATVATLTAEPGVYHVVDDTPVAVRDWLPFYAKLLAAAAPRRVPKLVGRLLAGSYAVHMMCEQRGISNAKAKRELGWTPAHPSWRDAIREELGT